MRALALTQHGGGGRLVVLAPPAPAIAAPDDVLIRVRSGAINHLDLYLTEGVKGINVTFPHIVGTDGAGVVEAVGAAVAAFRPGDRVLINPGISCGACAVCRAGEEPLCRMF